MYAEGEDIFYYLSLYNENYAMPPMPAGVEDGILKGLYKFKPGPEFPRVQRTSNRGKSRRRRPKPTSSAADRLSTRR